MDHTQTVKINNYKAQYNKILSSIDQKNKNLEAILEETLRSRTSLNFITSEIRKETQRLESLRLQSGQIEEKQKRVDQKLNEKQVDLSKQEVQLDLDRQIIAGKKTQREKEEDAYIANLQVEAKKLKDGIEKQNDKIERNVKEIDSFKEARKNIVTDVENQKKERNEQDIVLTQQIKDLQILKDSKVKELVNISGKIEDLYKEEAAAVERTKMPFKMLVERQRIMTQKEKDYAILTTRWRIFFEENFPGQGIKF